MSTASELTHARPLDHTSTTLNTPSAVVSDVCVLVCVCVCVMVPGEDGPSQMGLEDLAMFRAIPTATVFYPSDGVSTDRKSVV